jgi:hypothetical protein
MNQRIIDGLQTRGNAMDPRRDTARDGDQAAA